MDWVLVVGYPSLLLFPLDAPLGTDLYGNKMASLPLDSRAAVEDTRQASVYGFAIAFMIAITFVTLLRMYVRVFMAKAVGAEDSKWCTESLRLDSGVWLTYSCSFDGYRRRTLSSPWSAG